MKLRIPKDQGKKILTLIEKLKEDENYYLFLTMDRTASSISTLIEGMNECTFLQKKVSLETSLWVSPRNKIFTNSAIYHTNNVIQKCYDKSINIFN